MARELVALTREAFNELAENQRELRRRLGPQSKVNRRVQESYQWYWGKLASSLTAGSLEIPTTTTVNVWIPDTSSVADPVPFVIATDADLLGLTVVNRSSMTGTTGTMVKIEYEFGEWSIKWADC